MPLVTKDDIRVEDYYDVKTRAFYDHPLVSLLWNANDACWDDNPFCWDDVSFIIESFGVAVDEQFNDTQWIETYETLSKPEKKRFITLVAKVNGKEYEEKHKVKNIKISVKDIKLTVETVLDIKLDINRSK